MTGSQRQTSCDQRLLARYLEQGLAVEEERELEAHLDACPACRQRISASAAEEDWWNRAGYFLKADVWDGDGEGKLASHGNFKARELKSSDEIVVRQIREWFDPTDDPQFIGRFGGYEIVGVIGHGGMGVVLKGFERSLNRFVAIKVLSPALACCGTARQRFAREAKAAAAVLHENVIAIHSVADAHDLPYLVMPYVGGVSLQKRIDEEGPLPLTAVLRISRQIATGLAAAHAQGLVHRDIKPANILLERGVERVNITDFGLARAVDDVSLTKIGVIAGTPQYMSPQQARGESIDARSDLFSLGSVMYAMSTGHAPFRAETGYGILHRITDGQARPIRDLNPEIPDWFESIVSKLHAKAPSERFQTAAEVADLLEQCLAHVQQPNSLPLPAYLTKSSRLPSRRNVRWMLVIASIAVVIVAASWAVRSVLTDDSSLPSSGQNQPHSAPVVNAETNGEVTEAGTSWEGVSDEKLNNFDRELSEFQSRAGQDWLEPDSPSKGN